MRFCQIYEQRINTKLLALFITYRGSMRKEIPAPIQNIKTLKRLYFTKNQITQIPRFLNKLDQLAKETNINRSELIESLLVQALAVNDN